MATTRCQQRGTYPLQYLAPLPSPGIHTSRLIPTSHPRKDLGPEIPTPLPKQTHTFLKLRWRSVIKILKFKLILNCLRCLFMLSVVITVRNSSCGKVIFTARKRSLGQGNIFSSVCQEFCSQARGGGIPACIAGGIPACLAVGGYPSMYCRWYPSMPCSRGVSQHVLQVSRPTPRREVEGSGWEGLQAHTWGDGGVSSPHPGGVSQHTLRQTPLMATAGGMHPTGMHSCFTSICHSVHGGWGHVC